MPFPAVGPGSSTRRVRSLFRALKRRLVKVARPSRRVERPVCHDLASWAASCLGAERWVIDPAFTTSRPLPKTIEPQVHPSFAPLCSFPVPERALVKIPNGRVRGQVGLVVLPNGEFAAELVALTPAGRHSMLRAEPCYFEPLPKHALQKGGNFYPVLGLGVDHYYHWSHDVIMGMRGIADTLPSDTQLIVPERMQPFQIETLALLGLDDHPRVPFPAGAFWELENLYVVTPRLKTQIDSSEPYRWFREQIDLFGRAEVILGTGAGLFNMVFSPPGTKVLQFQEESHMVHALWTAAAAMNFDYHYFFCDSVPNQDRAIADIHVPIEKLEASLQAMAVS